MSGITFLRFRLGNGSHFLRFCVGSSGAAGFLVASSRASNERGQAGTARGGRRRAAARALAPWVAGTSLAAAVLMFCYLRIAGATQVNSDGAGLVLQASDMLHGNVLLHGWWATDVSFYTTELPEYLVVTAVAGVRPEVVHICSALTYTLLVLLAAFVARGRARGAEGVVRALLAAGIMLAPQPTGRPWCCSAARTTSAPAVPVLVLLLLLDWAQGARARPAGTSPVVAGRAARLVDRRRSADRGVGVVPAVPRLRAPGRAGSCGRGGSRRRPAAGRAGGRTAPRWALVRRLVRGGRSRSPRSWPSPSPAAGNRADQRTRRVPHRPSPFYGLQSLHEIVHGLPLAAAERARAVRRRLQGR